MSSRWVFHGQSPPLEKRNFVHISGQYLNYTVYAWENDHMFPKSASNTDPDKSINTFAGLMS